tara:strand:+ start:195 stop:800 length:606 start_codon:yes stop_codon:yes gene_type:complete
MKKTIKKFLTSGVLKLRKNRKAGWDLGHNKVFLNQFLVESSSQQYRRKFEDMINLTNIREIIYNITKKDMFTRYVDHPEVGLSFYDISTMIYEVDNSHHHAIFNDCSCGNNIGNSLYRWIRYLNFGDVDWNLTRPPTEIKHDETITCIAIVKKTGKVCGRKCLVGSNWCGHHRTWGNKREHNWVGKNRNDLEYDTIRIGFN